VDAVRVHVRDLPGLQQRKYVLERLIRTRTRHKKDSHRAPRVRLQRFSVEHRHHAGKTLEPRGTGRNGAGLTQAGAPGREDVCEDRRTPVWRPAARI
jgi:hypothetical protein